MYDENNTPVPQQLNATEVNQNPYYAYLDEISQYKLLSLDEEVSLLERIQNGDNVAKDLFIKSNLRLVVKIAKKYYIPGYNDILDLIQEGNLGLIQAVERFDPSTGHKFSTYAFSLINKAIQTIPTRTGSPLEIPQGRKFGLIVKIKQTIEKFEEEHLRKPSFAEISAILNVPVDKIIPLMPFIIPSVSLNSKVKEGEDERELIDVFDDYYKDDTSEVESAFIVKESKKEFRSILGKVLTEKELYILASRWGLFNTPIKSIAALMEELGMSKQGICQNEQRSLTKLRQYLASIDKSLSDFI